MKTYKILISESKIHKYCESIAVSNTTTVLECDTYDEAEFAANALTNSVMCRSGERTFTKLYKVDDVKI